MTTTTPGSYQSANLNANVTIGDSANTFQPNFQAYSGSFTVGSTLIPTNTTSIYAAAAIGLNSPVGTFINGGGMRVSGVAGVGGNVIIGGAGIGGDLTINSGKGITLNNTYPGITLNGGGGITLDTGLLICQNRAGVSLDQGDISITGGGGIVMSGGTFYMGYLPATGVYARLETNFIDGLNYPNNELEITGLKSINGSMWPPVLSLNAQTGATTIGSAGGSVAITNPAPGQINLEVTATGAVTSVNAVTGAVTISGISGVDVATFGQTITLSAPTIAAAQTTANTALADAATASAAAAAADAAALAAQGTANTALADAATASSAAAAAQGTANTALADAAAAQSTANSALALAGTAETTANSAFALATTADAAAAAAAATAATALAQSGVTAVNAGTGAITISAGTGISVGTSGSTITITNSSPGGGGVTSLNSLTGALTLAAGTNIDITPSGSTLTIQAKNYPISERATSTTPVNLTATTFATAQTILTYTITPTFVSDIDVNCSFYYQTNTNTIYDLIYYAQLDGTQIGITMKDSLSGVNHFGSVSLLASALAQTAASHTITIKAYAGSAPAAGNLTVIAVSSVAIANLV
jgi:hypothetical protein